MSHNIGCSSTPDAGFVLAPQASLDRHAEQSTPPHSSGAGQSHSAQLARLNLSVLVLNEAGNDKARRDETIQDKTTQDKTRQDKVKDKDKDKEKK